jgi:hypothetical protein
MVIGWGSKTIEARMRNISLRGMFIDMPQPLWVHAEFKVRLSLPEPIELDCVVKRVEPGRGGGLSSRICPKPNANSSICWLRAWLEMTRHGSLASESETAAEICRLLRRNHG